MGVQVPSRFPAHPACLPAWSAQSSARRGTGPSAPIHRICILHRCVGGSHWSLRSFPPAAHPQPPPALACAARMSHGDASTPSVHSPRPFSPLDACRSSRPLASAARARRHAQLRGRFLPLVRRWRTEAARERTSSSVASQSMQGSVVLKPWMPLEAPEVCWAPESR